MGTPLLTRSVANSRRKVVSGEGGSGEAKVGAAEGLAGVSEEAGDHGGGDAAACGVALALEQEGQRFAQLLLGSVPAPDEADGAPRSGVASDDLGDDVEQLGGHGDDPFAVGLGRGDHQ
jgi:hypothetical protein